MTLEEKIDRIYETVITTKTQQDQHRKELDEHAKALIELEAMKNKTLGLISLLGLFMGGVTGWIIKHFTQ